MNFYNISQVPERQQIAQHYHSSLEQPNFDNVEAQLFVARQRNYELAQQYFQNKYGNSQLYNKFVESNGLEGLGPPKKQQLDFKRELDKKALQIQEQEMRKIQQRKANGGRNKDEYDSGEYMVANRKNKERKNIWIEQEKASKQPEHIEEEVQPLEIDINQEKQGAFISEFKNYLTNKKKIKQEHQQTKNLTIDQSINISQFKNTNSSLSPQKQLSKSKLNDSVVQKSYEEELVKKIFRDLIGKVDKSSRIQKIQLVQYLTSSKKILKVLELTPEDVSRGIMNFNTKDSNVLTYSECLMYIYSCLGKHDDIKKLKAKEQFEEVPQGCMLSKQILNLFESTFKMMDKHNDLIIKRIPFINKLATDPLIKKSINLPAVFEPAYDRYISLRRIFERIEIETLLCSEEEKKLNEYISWNQFINYFQSGHKQRSKYEIIVLLESLKHEEKFGLSHVSESICDIINAAIKKADKGEELFSTIDIINEIKLHREYEIEKYTFIRDMSDNPNGVSQTFEDVLVRIKEHGQKYVSPKEFLEYFTMKGKPIEDFELQKNNQQTKNNSAARVTFIQQQLFAKGQEPNGYDSDPEMYNSNLHEKGGADLRKSQKQFKKFKETGQSFFQQDSKPNGFDSQQQFKPVKVTVPQPFSFQERERERRAAKAHSMIPESAEKTAFKAKPVPQKVIEVGLYDRMIQEQRKKNEQRKKCSMIMTLANQQPFSFQNRKINKKSKIEREEFLFKAKPIPWYCSVDLLNKKKQQEIVRNERIAKMAQQNLAKAKLPPRMEKDYLEKQAKKNFGDSSRKKETKSVVKVKEPPNFERIHKQFEEALERKRKQNKTTEIKQFKFASTKTNTFSKTKNEVIEEHPQRSSKPQIPSCLKTNIDIFAQSTAKFTQQVELRRKETEQKRKKEAQKKKEEEQRLKIDNDLKLKVQQAANKNKENKQKDEQSRRKQQIARQEENFKDWKNTCIQKGRQQPLLIDRITKRDEKIEKMKRLHDISTTLKKNGIKGKEHDKYFKREELLMLMDYEELKDKL